MKPGGARAERSKNALGQARCCPVGQTTSGGGAGEIRVTRSGQIKEIINYESDIGVDVSPKDESEEDTNRFTIHYSKARTHAVPASKRRKNS